MARRRAGRPFLPEDVRKEFEGFQILDNNWNLPGVIQQEDNCAKVRTDTKKGRCLRQVVLAMYLKCFTVYDQKLSYLVAVAKCENGPQV